MINIIDSVVLTPEAVAAWRETAQKTATAIRAAGIRVEPGIEEAYAQPDGWLLITCKVGTGAVNLLLPAGQWSMAN